MSKTVSKPLDFWSVVVIAVTLALFLLALFLKGFTHELLLEAGVFLVSVKLIILGYSNSAAAKVMDERFEEVQDALRRIEAQAPPQQRRIQA